MKIGQEGDPKPSFSPTRNPAVRDEQSEFGDSETLEIARHSHEVIQRSKKDGRDSRSSASKKTFYKLVFVSLGGLSRADARYDEIKTSTLRFSSDVFVKTFNIDELIGKIGCNRVYKGLLPDGKLVAVKVLKSCKEAWKDFTREVDIMNSLKHKNITPPVGVCVEDNALIWLISETGNNKGRYVLSWEVRFKVAVGIAEALNYLHNECSPSVIHRDVKSSNILLSDELEPQLSDFGLAIRGPTDSLFVTDNDVGVNCKPISSETAKLGPVGKTKTREWRSKKHMLMRFKFIEWLSRSARLRPRMSQFGDRKDAENQENADDEVYAHSSAESHLGVALLDVEDTSTSFSSVEQSTRTSWEEYLKGRWSRSSSLD
ncbi:protein kinase superfamily protein [Actinidia rufa]|uniref:Protein kinase superfamily protein n=1 Tax=Actinidia rufa TaxID=165716 RepID=A0A7J0DN84_9ERIC|nr:protein kinase superfamily protein [Actinidia rufa]